MKKVITYGTFDLLHNGHIRLLERAKALGDFLIVGVTADSFDMVRGKINVQQSLMERMEAVKATGLADEVIVEEYEGQKIDDIVRYNIDVFAIGSDWVGKFDYLNEFCHVVYLKRTEGISSTKLRTNGQIVRIGVVCDENEFNLMFKFVEESRFVNGVAVDAICVPELSMIDKTFSDLPVITDDYCKLLDKVDAVYVLSHLDKHYSHIKKALEAGRHVLCESPMTRSVDEWDEVTELAHSRGLVLMDAIRTAYSTAYYRMQLLVKSGFIGKIVSIDASCSSLQKQNEGLNTGGKWSGSLSSWGPNVLLPVFQLLGTDYRNKQICSMFKENGGDGFDLFTKISFEFPHAVASVKVGKGVKTEGDLVISGTEGYIYVPAPWWKTDYFEIRREDPTRNKRYFYQLDGEGIRYEIISFIREINHKKGLLYITEEVSKSIVKVMEDFYVRKEFIKLV